MGAISNFTFFDKCIKMGKNEICMGEERKRTYHILTAIMHMAQSEVFISKKFKQFILDAQQESENDGGDFKLYIF